MFRTSSTDQSRRGPRSLRPRATGKVAARIGASALFVLALPTAAAAAPTTGIKTGGDVANAACLAQAKAEHIAAGTCVAGKLIVASSPAQTGGDDAQATAATVPSVAHKSYDSQAARAGDDLDSWCEAVTDIVCSRPVDSDGFVAETKLNGVYWDNDGFIGAFDIIWRQNFSGPYPHWRLTLIWDYGPEVTLNPFYAKCRRHVSGDPDRSCGEVVFEPQPISSSSYRVDLPTPYRGQSDDDAEPLSGSEHTKYHDDLSGSFIVAGYTFQTGEWHTGRWHRCGELTGCRYYQIPWTENP